MLCRDLVWKFCKTYYRVVARFLFAGICLLLEINLIFFRHLLFLDKILRLLNLTHLLDLTSTHSGAKLDTATLMTTIVIWLELDQFLTTKWTFTNTRGGGLNWQSTREWCLSWQNHDGSRVSSLQREMRVLLEFWQYTLPIATILPLLDTEYRQLA